MSMLSAERHYRMILVLLLVASLLAIACASLNPQPAAPSALALKQVKPSIRGVITRVSTTGEIPHAVFVEGSDETDTAYDVASVMVRDNTRIYLQQADGYRIATVSQLTTGLRVEAVFTGTILEIYPVRAAADEILILEASH